MTLIRDITPDTSEYIFTDYSASLLNLSGLDSDWIDMEKFDKYQVEAISGTSGMTLKISSSRVDGGGQPDDIISTNIISSTFHLFNVICRQRFIKIEWINETGSAVSDCSLSIKVFRGASDKLSVFPVSTTPSIFSQAALVQSIMRGFDTNGVYQNVGVNTAGSLLTSDFGTEVSRDLYSGWGISTKFGRNPDIDTGTTPEDVYNGGGEYTGFNATSNENLRVLSSSGQDNGTLVSSGTATGGSDVTLIDSSATFITDGVAVGDCVINDTHGCHGFVTSIDSETQVTVYRMSNGGINSCDNESGNDYRIATTNGTGCAVLRMQSILNEDYEKQTPVYIIMNGTTPVIATADAMRCSVGYSVLSGSNGLNVGQLTVTQETSTSNVFAVIPTTGRTTIGCNTVPKNKVHIIKRMRVSLVRDNGSAGSATVLFNVREPYGSWRADRVFEVQNGGGVDFTFEGGLPMLEGMDYKFTVSDVSDNNTVIEVAAEYYEIDENS